MKTGVAGLRHGVHPAEHKTTTHQLAVERMPFVDCYAVPLSQHIGAPSNSVVKPGQRVARGQLIGAPSGFISTAQHAPVTGTVRAIEHHPHPNGKMETMVIIDIDPYDDQHLRMADPRIEDKEDLVREVQQAGIVGLGGAAFPSHVKLVVPKGKKVQCVMINGCECEPYLTCDDRLMVEYAPAVVQGLRLIMKQLDAPHGYVGVEINKPEAIAALTAAVQDDDPIQVVPLQVKYPQGAEKLLIDAVLHREVPEGKLPIDVGVVSYNVGSAVAIAQLVKDGLPLVERIVTVTGPGVRKPRNLMVPVGTPMRAVLDYCQVDEDLMRQVVMGGPMMGQAQKNLDAPVIKGTSGLLVLDRWMLDGIGEQPCIRCGRCLDACPMFLNPSRLAQMVRAEWVDEIRDHHLLNCFECGACSYVCPSHIPLAQIMRMGKALIREQDRSSA